MKPLNFDSTSWHFRLATVYGKGSEGLLKYNGIDICSYIRLVLGGMCVAALTIALVTLAMWGVVDLVLVTLAGLTLADMSYLGQLSVTIVAVLVVSVIVLAVISIVEERLNRRARQTPELKRPSFIKQAYRSLKNKTCVYVNFDVDEHTEETQ